MSAHAIFYKKVRSKPFFFYALCVICVGLVAINMVYSQKYNKNMYGVMEGESGPIITYLKHIWGTPLFDLELQAYKAEGRDDIVLKWSEVQLQNEKKILSLESALRLYPYSPELNYNLSLLYAENGSKEKANESLQKARHIDPSL